MDLDHLLESDHDTLLDGGLVRGRELCGEVVDEIDAVDLDGGVQMRGRDGSDERTEGHCRELIVEDFIQREVAESSDRQLDAEDGATGREVRDAIERQTERGRERNLFRILTRVGTATELARAMPFSRKETLKIETEAQ